MTLYSYPQYRYRRWIGCLLLLLCLNVSGCLRYSFTGTSIPADVNTIYIPFFEDRSGGGLGDLRHPLNSRPINRFVHQSRLTMTNYADSRDAWLEGSSQGYTNRQFSIGGD